MKGFGAKCILWLALVGFTLAGCNNSPEELATTQGSTSLTSIEITGGADQVSNPSVTQFEAWGKYSDGSQKDLTQEVTWSSTDELVAQVSNRLTASEEAKGTVTAQAAGNSLLVARLGQVAGQRNLVVKATPLVALRVEPAYVSASLQANPSIQYQAFGQFADGSFSDLTSLVKWDSGNDQIATIAGSSNPGLISALRVGSTKIYATYGQTWGLGNLHLTDNAISGNLLLTPQDPTIISGSALRLTASVALADGSTQDLTSNLQWSSSSTSVAGIADQGSQAKVTTLSTGTSSLSASFSSTSATAVTLTSSAYGLDHLQINPTQPQLAKGTSLQLKAWGLMVSSLDYEREDLTQEVQWSSSQPQVISVCNSSDCKGKLTANPTPYGEDREVTITATLGAKSTSITATLFSGHKVASQLQFGSLQSSLPTDLDPQLRVFGSFYDGSQFVSQELTGQALLYSQEPQSLIADNRTSLPGRLVPIGAGSVRLFVQKDDLSQSRDLEVLGSNWSLGAIQITPPVIKAVAGMETRLKAWGLYTSASGKRIIELTPFVLWSSSDTTIAKLHNARADKGRLKSLAAGSATITASFKGVSGSANLTNLSSNYAFTGLEIDPPLSTLAKGASLPLKATGIFYSSTDSDYQSLDLTEYVNWINSDNSVIDVTNGTDLAGWLLAKKAGSATVTASTTLVSTLKSDKLTLTSSSDLVIKSLQPIQETSRHVPGQPRRFELYALYGSDDSQQAYQVTQAAHWDSSCGSKSLEISNQPGSKGQGVSLKSNDCIWAASFGGKTAWSKAVSKALGLSSLRLDPADPKLIVGQNRQIKAYGTFSNGKELDLTRWVTWTSGTTAVATVEAGGEKMGRLTGVAPGSSSIKAELEGLSSSGTITVFSAAQGRINPSLSLPTTLFLNDQGQANFSLQVSSGGAAHSLDLTQDAVWASSATSVVKVSNAEGRKGRLTAHSTGSASITVYFKDQTTGVLYSLSGSVTVDEQTIKQLALNSYQNPLTQGDEANLKLFAQYTSSSTTVNREVTQTAVWSSSDPAVAQVSNQPGQRGKVMGISPGTVTITASYQDLSYSTSLTIAEEP